MMKEERREKIACAVDRDLELRRAQSPEPCFVAGQHVESVGGRIVEIERLRDDDQRPMRSQRSDRPPRGRQVADRLTGQPFTGSQA